MELATTSLWRNRNFTVLFITSVLTGLAAAMNNLTLPLLIYNLTHSSVAMSTMKSMELLPLFLFGIAVGIIVDRVNTKRLQQWTLGIQTVTVLLLWSWIRLGTPPMYVWYAAGFFLSLSFYAFENVRVCMTRHIVPVDQLTSANALQTAVATVIKIMGPVLGALALLAPQLDHAFLWTACLLVLSLAASSRLTVAPGGTRYETSLKEQLAASVRLLKHNQRLLTMTIFYMMLNATYSLYEAVLIYHLRDKLGMSPVEVGCLLALSGVGGIVGSMSVARGRKKWGAAPLFGLTIVGQGIASLLLYAHLTLVGDGVALLLYGCSMTMTSILGWSIRQETTPAEAIGTITGLTGTLFRGLSPLFMLGSGYLAQGYGTHACFLAAGVLNGIVYLTYVYVQKSLPRQRIPHPRK